jgi:anthranilate phosphoribosyltransferase
MANIHELLQLHEFEQESKVSTSAITAEQMQILIANMFGGIYDTETVYKILTSLTPESLTSEQLAGVVNGIVESAAYKVRADQFTKPVIVPVGTGGDMRSTVNVTTMAGFVMAASGECNVALYGNKKSSGNFGKMDLLESAGIPIELSEDQIHEELHEHNIVPVYARTAYPGARHVAEARSQIKRSTIFNIAFPIAAPVVGQDVRMLIGSARDETLASMAEISASRGVQRSIFVRDTENGMDEVSLDTTRFVVIGKNGIEDKSINVGSLLQEEIVPLQDLQACGPEEFVSVFQQTLDPRVSNTRIEGVRRIVAANAACGLYLAQEHSNGFEEHFPEYYTQAMELIKNGDAFQKVAELAGR